MPKKLTAAQERDQFVALINTKLIPIMTDLVNEIGRLAMENIELHQALGRK